MVIDVKHLKLIFIMTSIFLLGFINHARTATLDVCPSGCTYSSIQQAIDAAAEGDMVLVAEGTYAENINLLGKAIEVRSISGAATTVIEGQVGAEAIQATDQDGCPDMPELNRYYKQIDQHYKKKEKRSLVKLIKKLIKKLKRKKNKYKHDVALKDIKVKKKIKKCDKSYKIKVSVKNNTKTPETAQVVLYKNGEEVHRWTDVKLKRRQTRKLTYSYKPAEDSCLESVCWSAEVIIPDDQIPQNNTSWTRKTKLECDCDGGSEKPVVSVVTFNSNEDERTILDGFTIMGGAAANGGGISCENASPVIRNCLIQGNNATGAGGGVYFNYSQATLENCDILSNSASSGGGIYIRYGLVKITRCIISGNTSSGNGGGCNIEDSPSMLINCLISRNFAVDGGGIITNDYPVITNCTVADNTASGRGGGIFCPLSQPLITNSIFWGNGEEIFGNATTTYSIVQGGYAGAGTQEEFTVQGGYEGTGNLNSDPLFVDSAAGDYHLQADSPAIDNALAASAPADDLDGNARPQLSGDDIGAYEIVISDCQPWAAFSTDPVRVDIESGLVDFEATGSFDMLNVTFDWDFGDGETGSGQRISHIYYQAGYYTVELKVSTNCGSSSYIQENYILVGPAGIILDVPGDFPTIQRAIDAAIDSDIIVIAPGIYTENLNFKGKEITVRSSDGASATIIDGGARGSVVSFDSGETASSILKDLTIQNGDAISGGGIHILNSSPTILDCIISANSADSGGGIYAEGSNPIIRRTRIIQNSSEFGGGIALYSASAQITNCLIAFNDAVSGGGIYDDSASPNIMNCTVYLNTAASGNGMYTYSSYPVVTNTLFWNTVPEISVDFSFPTVTYSYVSGGYTGTGNIDSDLYPGPYLSDPGMGNYNLLKDSPLIDQGTTTGAPTDDLYQNTRDDMVDIGAYEFFFINTDPEVTVNAPYGGEGYTGDLLTIRWRATDAEHQNVDELKADIYYRRGLVGTWTPIVGNILCTHNVQTSYVWDIGALMNGNDYTVRIVVSDGFGGSGEDTSDSAFTIDRTPPSFSGITSAQDTNIDGTVDLSWGQASDPSKPITYNIYIASTSGSQDFSSSYASSQGTSYRIIGLSNNREYFFVVRAMDLSGNEDTNTSELSATPSLDVTPPIFTGLVSATDANIDGTVDLSWNAAVEPNGPVTYNIYFATTPGGQNFSIPYTTTPQTSYRVTGLTNDQSYYFVVRAEDAYGNEDGNTSEKNVSPTRDSTPPTFSGLVSATDANTDGTVDLSWNAAGESNGPITYNIYFATTPGGQIFSTPDATTQDTSYQVTGLTNDQVYYFVVRAEDRFENEDENTLEKNVTPTRDSTPPVFAGLTSAADAHTGGMVNLFWDTATEPNMPVTYNIYYSTTPGGQNFSIPHATTRNISYQVTGLTDDQIYYFVVRAEDAYDNEGTNGVELSATPTDAPGDTPSGAVGYWRFNEGSGNTASDETVNANDGTITGASWTTGKTGNALSFDGVGDYVDISSVYDDMNANAGSVELWANPASIATNDYDFLFGHYNSGNRLYIFQSYENLKYRLGNSAEADSGYDFVAGEWVHIVLVYNNGTARLYVNGSLAHSSPYSGLSRLSPNFAIGDSEPGYKYKFNGLIDEVITYNKALTAAEVLNRFNDTTPPIFSGLVSAVDAQTDGTVELSWSAASDPGTPITYNIYYATSPGGYGFANAVTQNTSYRITGLTNNQRYYFVVRAQDSIGNEDDNMVELSATPTLKTVIP